MKKIKRFLSLLFALLIFALSAAACSGNSTSKYDAKILKTTSEASSGLVYNNDAENPFIQGSRYFNVVQKSDGEFFVDVNGTQATVILADDNEENPYVPTHVKNLSNNLEDLYSQSKELVYKYIDTSNILTNKEALKHYIYDLSAKQAIFTDESTVAAYFSTTDNMIYVNKDNLQFVSEWAFVHELVHAISYYTHGCDISNEPYAYSLFNEIMTDIITESMNPVIDKSLMSGYNNSHLLLYPYINLVGTDAILAYFYGYDEIYKNLNKDEFEFFVFILDDQNIEYFSAFYNNIICKWYAEYSETAN